MKIELGETSDMPMNMPEKAPEKWYPHIELSTSDELSHVPDSGTATITFEKSRFSVENLPDGGKKYRCDLKVKDIDFGGKAPKKKKKGFSDEDEVEQGIDEAMKSSKDDEKED